MAGNFFLPLAPAKRISIPQIITLPFGENSEKVKHCILGFDGTEPIRPARAPADRDDGRGFARAPVDRANFPGLVLGCTEAKFGK